MRLFLCLGAAAAVHHAAPTPPASPPAARGASPPPAPLDAVERLNELFRYSGPSDEIRDIGLLLHQLDDFETAPARPCMVGGLVEAFPWVQLCICMQRQLGGQACRLRIFHRNTRSRQPAFCSIPPKWDSGPQIQALNLQREGAPLKQIPDFSRARQLGLSK